MEGRGYNVNEAKNLHHLWGAGDYKVDAYKW